MMNLLQKHEVRLIKSHQTAEILLSMRPQTPVNIFLFTELLRTHLNQNVDANFLLDLTSVFGWVSMATNPLEWPKTFPQVNNNSQ